MKNNTSLTVLLLSVIILVSCSQQMPTVDMIEPGDMIGDMIINTVPEGENLDGWIWEYCDMEIDGEAPVKTERKCIVPPLPYVFLTAGMDTGNPLWPESTWEIYIDGQRVNLEEFGTIDLLGIRFWNLRLDNPTPGEHTFHTIITFSDDAPDSYELVTNFTVGAQEKSYPPLSPVAVKGQHPYTSEEAGLNYLLYIPEDYGVDPQKEWPLILSLHGHPKGLGSLDLVRKEGLTEILDSEGNFPSVVISPLRDEGYFEYWYQDKNVLPLFVLLEEVQSLYSIDPKRIYLTGGSGGANGVWEIGLQYPERFTALVPVMGYYGYPFEVPDNICDLEDVPIWAFHGALDEVVPLDAEQSLVDALDACGGDVQFTVFPDEGHDLDQQQVWTSEFVTWLLKQTFE